MHLIRAHIRYYIHGVFEFISVIVVTLFIGGCNNSDKRIGVTKDKDVNQLTYSKEWKSYYPFTFSLINLQVPIPREMNIVNFDPEGLNGSNIEVAFTTRIYNDNGYIPSTENSYRPTLFKDRPQYSFMRVDFAKKKEPDEWNGGRSVTPYIYGGRGKSFLDSCFYKGKKIVINVSIYKSRLIPDSALFTTYSQERAAMEKKGNADSSVPFIELKMFAGVETHTYGMQLYYELQTIDTTIIDEKRNQFKYMLSHIVSLECDSAKSKE